MGGGYSAARGCSEKVVFNVGIKAFWYKMYILDLELVKQIKLILI